MSEDAFPMRAPEPELRTRPVLIQGNGAANPTKLVGGRGMTCTWISTGLYQIVFNENPGAFAGFSAEFQATTMSQLKGFTAVLGDLNTSTFTVQISITNASETLTDLTSTQKLAVVLWFKEIEKTV